MEWINLFVWNSSSPTKFSFNYKYSISPYLNFGEKFLNDGSKLLTSCSDYGSKGYIILYEYDGLIGLIC